MCSMPPHTLSNDQTALSGSEKKRSMDVDGSVLPKILVVAPSIRIMGGQAVMAKQLLDDFHSSGFNADFLPINPKPPGPLAFAERIKYVRTLCVSFFYIFSLIVRVPRYEIIHIFSASYLSFIITQTPAILISRLYGKKIVLNYHSGQCEDHLRRWGQIVYFILRRVDKIVVQSEFLVEAFRKHGFEATAIANVVDVTRFPYRNRIQFQPHILVPRMLDPIYNVACSVRAFAIVKRQIPDAKLTLLGDGADESPLRELVQQLRLEDVHFIGRVSRDRIATVFAEHDILVNSSDIDNMPVSLLEGFASGLPVITTAAGGIPWMVKDRVTGHLVPLNDHDSLAARILETLTNQSATQSMVERARQQLEHYCWPAVSQDWFDVYASLDTRTGKIL